MKTNPKDLNEIINLKYISNKKISPNTYIYTYELPNDNYLGINVGQHIAIE